ncbi:MAG TPA: ammonium transporter [Acidimicrobiales bacterium]|nr:ammonium transporter [Acidimicrobiales bacterium]
MSLLLHMAQLASQTAGDCTKNAVFNQGTASAVANTCSDPNYIDTGDTSWQLTAATFVGLMSLPGLAVLYAGLVPKRWAVNTMFMAFSGFSAVLVVWVLWGYKMGFGTPIGSGGAHTWTNTYASNGGGFTGFIKNFFENFVGHPQSINGSNAQMGQATLYANNGATVPLQMPSTALAYFQFVFAGITPLLFLGSVLGRIKPIVWMIFVPAWCTFVYCVNAMLIWGGGYWGHEGALDYSGGYVIHLAAGVSGFVAAWVIGPRLARDRAKWVPHSLTMVAVGAGIVWLGWNGFNGGDPYFSGIDAGAAVINTNMATAAALLTWVVWDILLSKQKKPTLLGAINGMICGLVGITPAAGYVSGSGALWIGMIASTIVWFAWTYIQPITLKKVDDASGVVFTHGLAGLTGGLMVGVLADPGMVIYHSVSGGSITFKGLMYGNPKQLLIQALAALTVIVWDGLVTFILLKVIGLICGGLRIPDDQLEIGDAAVHDEEAYPSDEGYTRVTESVGAFAQAGIGVGASTPAPAPAERPSSDLAGETR